MSGRESRPDSQRYLHVMDSPFGINCDDPGECSQAVEQQPRRHETPPTVDSTIVAGIRAVFSLCEHDITPRNIRGEFRPKDLICEVRKVTPWGTARPRRLSARSARMLDEPPAAPHVLNRRAYELIDFQHGGRYTVGRLGTSAPMSIPLSAFQTLISH